MTKFSNVRWEKMKEVEEILCRDHPKAFVPFQGDADKVYPLKVGIDKDIVLQHPEIDLAVLKSFLKHYVSMPRYLKICGRPGMPRVDLDGDVTDVISEFAAKKARNFLEVTNRHRPKVKTVPVSNVMKPCSVTGKVKYTSAFEANQAMARTLQRSGFTDVFASGSFKCTCGFFHWGRG